MMKQVLPICKSKRETSSCEIEGEWYCRDMSFRIVKRDKSIEDFNAAKLLLVTTSSGLSEEEAKKLCVTIQKWAEGTKKPLITTLQIRDRIITELQKTNHDAADHFIEYEKTRDKSVGGPNS